MALLLLLSLGCGGGVNLGDEEIDTEYGKRAGSSVNGTSVLADMFQEAGHRVSSWRALSPKLERADTIVWFPDDSDPPSYAVCEWLENWLERDPARTLIYVGRDYDAEPLYWRTIRPLAPPEQVAEVDRRLAVAEQRASFQRLAAQSQGECRWFKQRAAKPRTPARLRGPWSQNVDAAKTKIELNARLEHDADAEPLLLADGETVASLQLAHWDEGGQVIVVSNGSFLLNLPLVNHEHRKLAGKLVAEVGSSGRVVFLESGPGGVPIHHADPEVRVPTGLEVFGIWPLSFILLHLAVLGLAFCFSRFPIFGRPRDPRPHSAADFGIHIVALGELLQQTHDQQYAAARVAYYHQHVRGN